MEKINGSFELTEDGILLHVNWDRKNFEVTAHIGGMVLSEYCHLMFMCPRAYTEEEVLIRCNKLLPVFRKAHSIIINSTSTLKLKKEEFLKLKAKHDAVISDLNAKRREFKQQLITGSILKKEYDEEIVTIKKWKKEIWMEYQKYLNKTAGELTFYNSECTSIIYNYLNDYWNLREGK